MEDMVGEIKDETDNDGHEIEQIDQNTIRVKGDVLLREVLRALKVDQIKLPQEMELEDFEDTTLSYLILAYLKHFPQAGQKIVFEPLEITIEKVDKNGAIEKVLVKKIQK